MLLLLLCIIIIIIIICKLEYSFIHILLYYKVYRISILNNIDSVKCCNIKINAGTALWAHGSMSRHSHVIDAIRHEGQLLQPHLFQGRSRQDLHPMAVSCGVHSRIKKAGLVHNGSTMLGRARIGLTKDHKSVWWHAMNLQKMRKWNAAACWRKMVALCQIEVIYSYIISYQG